VAARIHAYQELLESSGAFAREQARWPQLCAPDLAQEVSFMTFWYARNVEAIDSALYHSSTVPSLELQPQLHITTQGITIDSPNAMVTLYSTHGQMLYNAYQHTSHSIALPQRGTYIIHITTGDRTYTTKIYYPGS
jgi:hypothetical protein